MDLLHRTTGATWWFEPSHRWLAERERERADTEAVAHLGRGTLVVALSGGKDSTAVALWLEATGFREAHEDAGGETQRYFQDVGWELPTTYEYMVRLKERFGVIQHCALWVPGPGERPPSVPVAQALGVPTFWVPLWKTPGKVMDLEPWEMVQEYERRLGQYSAFLRLIAQRASFVAKEQRWCSREMKTDVAAAYLATLDDPWTVAGVRAEESEPRAQIMPWDWSGHHDAWAWSPIKWWTIEQVRAYIVEQGFTPNPLYLEGAGAGRVGCGPCIFSNRADLRWLLLHHKERLVLLADFERDIAKLPQAQKHYDRGAPPPTWFTGTDDRTRKQVCKPLPEILNWAKAERGRGAKQLSMFFGHERPGCSAWGLCEVPKPD